MADTDDIESRIAMLNAKELAAGGPEVMIAGLVKGLKQQDRRLKLLVVSVIFDVLLSVVLGVVVVRQNANTTVGHVSCQAQNDFRSRDRQLWNFIETLPVPAGLTPLQVSQSESSRQALNSYLDKTFVLRNC